MHCPSTELLRRANMTTCQGLEEDISGEWVPGSEPGPNWPPWTTYENLTRLHVEDVTRGLLLWYLW